MSWGDSSSHTGQQSAQQVPLGLRHAEQRMRWDALREKPKRRGFEYPVNQERIPEMWSNVVIKMLHYCGTGSLEMSYAAHLSPGAVSGWHGGSASSARE